MKMKFLFYIALACFTLSCSETKRIDKEKDNEISNTQSYEQGEKLYKANCAACHSINTTMVGPKLGCIGKKYSKEWLYLWIRDSQKLIESGDADAVAVFEKFNKIQEPAFPSLSDKDIDNLIYYLDSFCE